MVPKDKYLNVNCLRLHYLDWGKGGHRAMLLLHGFMAHAHVWDEFALRFRKQYHIIALDQRGHGESQWSNNGFYSVDDHFSDITEIIKILHLKNLILIGHSMGGRNALFYTACCPNNIERLILIDARLSSNPKNSKALRHHLIHLPHQAFSLNEVVQAIQDLYPYLSKKKCHHLAYHGYQKRLDGKFVPKFDIRMSLQSNRLGCVTEDLRPFLTNITRPTLIIRGKESLFLSRADTRKISSIIPNAKMKEIPKATHLPFQESPRAFQKVILDFLNENT
jgi:pimeloyl-ACP methyl ester carboxylesterase